MATIVDIDIETFSTVELKKSNVYAYTEDPSFDIPLCAIGINDGPIEAIEGQGAIMAVVKDLLRHKDVTWVAHNAGFERVCFSTALGMPVGTYLPPDNWFDPAAVAALHGLPRGLEALAKALQVTPKDGAGTRLINLFCKLYRGRRVMPSEKPEQWQEFIDYCVNDVQTMREIRHVFNGRGWPEDGFEKNLWILDQKINDFGIAVDLDIAKAAMDVAHENTKKTEAEVIALTGVTKPGSTKQLGAWCAEQGFEMENWQATTVKDALSRSDIPEEVEKVLELRQELALVAHRKFEAVLRGVSSDGRLRGQFKYHAAHTGRWSSQGVQVHNLPKLSFEEKHPETGEKYYSDSLERCAIDHLLLLDEADPTTLKKLVRPMLVLDGVTSDFSAIEARVLAWLAGEDWVLQAFMEGRDLYVENAERMGGGMGRPDGKIAVLAGGYQGSIGSFRNMGYGGRRCPRDTLKGALKRAAENPTKQTEILARMEAGHAREIKRDPNHKDDAEIKALVNLYRDANPRIQEFWYEMEKKFWTGGTVGAGQIRVEVKGTSRWIHLPSGRILKYRNVHKRTENRTDPDTGEITGTKQTLVYKHVQGYYEKTYGGRLTENVTQAVARDLLAYALLCLAAAGYTIVGHVHDEALVASRDTEGIREIMRTGPAWAEGLPLDASADYLYRYRKD